jgi:hypothetical protein
VTVITVLVKVITLGICREDVRAVIESPDGRSQIVVDESDCGGATTSAFTTVKVNSLDSRLATEVILSLDSKYTEDLIVGRWISNTSVRLTLESADSIHQYLPTNRASLDLDLQLVLK